MDRQSNSILRLGRSCCVRSGPAAAGAAVAVVLPWPHSEEHNEQDAHEQDDDAVTGPFEI